MDTRLIQAPHYYGHPLNMDTSLLQTAFSLVKESPYIFSKFDRLNIMDTLLIQTLSLPPYVSILGSFNIDDGDASENVTIKTNSRFFFSFCVYSTLLKISNAGQCPRVGFLGTVLKFRKRKKNSQSLVYILHKTGNQAFSRRSRVVTARKCTKKHDARGKLLFCLINQLF